VDGRDEFAAVTALLAADRRFAAAVLFGSAARGALRPGSDIDLAVIYRDNAARDEVRANLVQLLGELTISAGREVHLVDLERVDCELGRRIASEGRVLFDGEPPRLGTLFTRALIDYFDWAYARSVIDAGQARRLGSG